MTVEAEGPEEEADFAAWQARVAGTNISATTLLATDYMNHLNEIVMLLEMVPDMPEMLEDCAEWTPKSYKQHFADSGFSDRELAMAAYDHAPPEYRGALERTIYQFVKLVSRTRAELSDAVARDDPATLREKTNARVAALQELVQVAIGIIHGTTRTLSQEEIDDMIAI